MSAFYLRLDTACFVFAVLGLAACNHHDDATHSHDEEHQHDDEDLTIPDEFADQENPFGADDEAAVSAGKTLYKSECSACHGTKADGKGPSAEDLEHECPSLVSDEAGQWNDDFFLYRISVGEKDHGMPGFGDELSKQEIWQIVSYVRSLQAASELIVL